MWNKMETFYHIVKAGSFTKAEKILNKSQTTLTHSVQVLENRLGCRLLNRSVKGLTLTRKGEEVFQMDMEGLKKNLHDNGKMQGSVKINTTYAIANYVLSDLLFDFNEEHPDLIIEIICSDTLIDIVQQEVDIAITSEFKNNPDIVYDYFYTVQPNLYASPGYINKFGKPARAEDLDKHRLLAYSRPIDNPYFDVEWHLKLASSSSKRKNAVYRANSVECLFAAAERGIGILSSYENMKILKDSSLININPDIKGPECERSTGQAPWYPGRPIGRVQAALVPSLLVLDALCNA